MKTHVLLVSQDFPKTHPRRGESTGFVEAIQSLFTDKQTKIHTIRSNYDWWKKRIDEVNAGEAVLSIRYWAGKPYHKDANGIGQVEILRLTSAGIQCLLRFPNAAGFGNVCDSDGAKTVRIEQLAKNDSLPLQDFKDWFEGYDLSNPMAIIHFSTFRY